jgi:hypothetical protein
VCAARRHLTRVSDSSPGIAAPSEEPLRSRRNESGYSRVQGMSPRGQE